PAASSQDRGLITVLANSSPAFPFTPDGRAAEAAVRRSPVGSAIGSARVVVRRAEDFRDPADRVRWDALAQQAAEPKPFSEGWYLLPSLDALDPTGSVRVLCVETAGRLVGLLPLARGNRYYGRPLPHWHAWVHDNIFCALPLVARGTETLFWRAVLAWADEA